ncbi:LysR family transcriptional regulator [Enterobacteriaceae bacterium ESL0689]|nr:LysR family transcriptional regulator [Enterobacteriaceae bacterium ESL0689]
MVNLYNLKKFDLNLLIIFECIYQHLSISKAAEILFITPSAVSQSLKRLRCQLNDPLFIRSGNGVTPTQAGIHLHYQLENCLTHLEQVIKTPPSPELTKHIIIYTPLLGMPAEFLQFIRPPGQASSVQIEHHDLPLSAGVVDSLLTYHKADLILSLSPCSKPQVFCHPFREIKMVLVCRKDHPRAEKMTSLAAISEEGFTHYLTTEPAIKAFQLQVRKLLPQLSITFRSDSYLTILNMIHQIDVVSAIPEAIFQHPFFRDSLQLLPVVIPSMKLYLICHHEKMSQPFFTSLFETINFTPE